MLEALEGIFRQVGAIHGVAGEAHEHAANSAASRPQANLADDGFFDGKTGQAAGIGEGGGGDDSGAVLVVVHDGDIQAGLEPFFNLKAARGRDIFQLDGGKGGGDVDNGFDDLGRVFGGQ